MWNTFKFYSPGKQRQMQHGNQKAYKSTSVHDLSKVSKSIINQYDRLVELVSGAIWFNKPKWINNTTIWENVIL